MIKTLSNYLFVTALTTMAILVLCTVYVARPDMVNGMVTGKLCWFNQMLMLFGGLVFLSVLFRRGKIRYSFSLADALVILFLAIAAVCYPWKEDPAPVRIVYICQLVVLWFLFRITFQLVRGLANFLLFILMYTGLVEALWGIGQLYGFMGANHSLFKLTGSFYNPGPYSGYLAMVFPIALSLIFENRTPEKAGRWNITPLFYYCALFTVVAIITVLPAGMSRTAWVAVCVSGGWVLWRHLCGGAWLLRLWEKHRKGMAIGAIFVLVVLIGAAIGVYLLKKNSADGRLFMWKITSKAIVDHSFMGTGAGGFPAAYRDAQEAYFASGEASDTEKLVAGSPEYAFNEYLQIILEQGLAGGIVFIALLIYCFYKGVKNGQTAACGGLISLAIFAFASYPLQLPSFCIILIFLLALAMERKQTFVVAEDREGRQQEAPKLILFSLLLAAAATTTYYLQDTVFKQYAKWSNLKMLHQIKAHEVAIKGYEELYPILKYNGSFLFEYAQCLGGAKKYEDANSVLKQALQHLVDPMIYNVMAKNYQALEQYTEAEKYLVKSINLLPERIYPYYLLTKLYADSGFYQPDKVIETGGLVMTKEPKVQSTAIKEMREEVGKLLDKIENK